MPGKIRARWSLLAPCAPLVTAGCILVFPIDDAPPADAEGGGGGAPSAGSGGGGRAGGRGGSAGADSGSGGEGGEDSPPPECTENADCADVLFDEPGRCRQGRCLALKTAECPLVYGESFDANAIYLGAYAVLDFANLESSDELWLYRLALDEFNADGVRGLPPREAGGDRRPLVMIACDSAADTDLSGRHLIEDVEVPAVLASLKTGDLTALLERYVASDGAFFLSPLNGSAALNQPTDRGLLWTLLGSPADYAAIYAAALARLERYLLDNLLASAPLIVATVSTTDAYSEELADNVPSALRFNGGRSVAQNLADDLYFAYQIDTSDLAAVDDEVERVTNAVFASGADIVISLADGVFAQQERAGSSALAGLIQRLESTFTLNSRTDRPYYVLSPLNKVQFDRSVADQVRAMRALFDSNADRRFIGVGAAPAADLRLYDGFVERLNRNFPSASPLGNNYYDAFYFLAYAMAGAVGVPELRPRDIALGMQRLVEPDRTRYDVGPSAIPNVFTALGSPDVRISLFGTVGPPDFNELVGTGIESGALSCFDAEGRPVVDAMRYDRAAEELAEVIPNACFREP